MACLPQTLCAFAVITGLALTPALGGPPPTRPAGAELRQPTSPEAAAPASNLPPVALLTSGSNVVAFYDEGKITAADVAERLAEPAFLADASQNAPADAATSDNEKIARHLAALRILVNAAVQRGFAKGLGWQFESRLVEQRVLADALGEETRRQVSVSEQEVADQLATNRFVLLGFDVVEAGRIGISAKKHGDKAPERAKAALAQIRRGKDFAAVAKEYSDLDPGLAQTTSYPANYWGKQNGLALGALGEGKVSDPLPVEDGFELVELKRIHLRDNPSPEQAKSSLRLTLTETTVAQRIADLMKAADGAFPFVPAPPPSPSTLNSQPSTNAVLLQCGQFAITREDVRGFTAQRGVPDLAEQKALEIIQQENAYQIQMGELARSMGFGQRPEVQKALRYALDKELAEKARRVLLPEFAGTLTFDENRIREAYDSKFTATFEPQIQYDVLVVPIGAPANAKPEEREAAVSNAQAKAEALIRRVQEGTRFDSLVGEPGVQFMGGQSRTVREGSALFPIVSNLKSGEVAAQPYEDFGGFCVLRVNKYEERRKMPYDLAKNYIVQDFRTQALGDLRRNFESVLLTRHHFTFGPPAAAARTGPSESAAAGKTNNQP